MFSTAPTSDTLVKINEAIKQCAINAHDVGHRESSVGLSESKGGDEGTQSFTIDITTADKMYAGTSANCFISLFNKHNCSSGVIKLEKEKSVSNNAYIFQRGQTDTFEIDGLESIGDIKRIRIGHDDSGLTPAWLPEKVVVRDNLDGNEFSFYNSDSLYTNRNILISLDVQPVKDLLVCKEYTLQSKDFIEEIVNGDVTDYCPKVFRNIRNFYGIGINDYKKSWTLSEDKLELKEGAGRSGSLFLKSNDGKYMMKTVPYVEVQTFLGVLNAYYYHLIQNNNKTLIMRMVGMHKVRGLYLIVFCNCLYSPSGNEITVYDLKGRKAKSGKQFQNTDKGNDYVFKDKDLDRRFAVRDEQKLELLSVLKSDLDFFAKNNLMDYSFLIGVSKKSDIVDQPPNWVVTYESSADYDEVYHIGFIDCLTCYNTFKKVAHTMKRFKWKTAELSTVNSQVYSDRIGLFLMTIFEDEQLLGKSTSYQSFDPMNYTEGKSVDDTRREKHIALLEAQVSQLQGQVNMLTRSVKVLELTVEKQGLKLYNEEDDDEDEEFVDAEEPQI